MKMFKKDGTHVEAYRFFGDTLIYADGQRPGDRTMFKRAQFEEHPYWFRATHYAVPMDDVYFGAEVDENGQRCPAAIEAGLRWWRENIKPSVMGYEP